VFSYDGGGLSNVTLTGIKVTGGPAKYFDTNATSGYTASSWTVDGLAVPNRTA
jgi:hypothetical protein